MHRYSASSYCRQLDSVGVPLGIIRQYNGFHNTLFLTLMNAKGLNKDILFDRNEWRRMIHTLDLA